CAPTAAPARRRTTIMTRSCATARARRVRRRRAHCSTSRKTRPGPSRGPTAGERPN
ncbi:MAG: hypothetical protein AVDCRST_MAG09-495, partial [uncultured Sphingomonas sp.]